MTSKHPPGPPMTLGNMRELGGKEMNVDWTVDQINIVAQSFDDLDAEVNNIRREIERKYFSQPIVSVD